MASRPTSYHHGDLRAALISAGQALLDAEGVEAIGLREAARRCRVSHAAPLRHFPDRGAYLTAVAVACCQDLLQHLHVARDHAGPECVPLRETGLAYIHYARQFPHRFRLVWRCDQIDTGDPGYRETMAAVWQVLIDAMRGFLAEHRLGEEDLQSRSVLAMAVVHGIASLEVERGLNVLGQATPLDPAMMQAVFTFLGAGLAAPVSAPRAVKRPQRTGPLRSS